MTFTRLQYWKKYVRATSVAEKAKDVSVLPDGGDMLTFIYGVWRGLSATALSDPGKQFYCQAEPKPHTVGRTVLFKAEIGSHGDPSSVVDTTTGQVQLDNPYGTLSDVVPQRLVLLVPTNATSAFLAIEHLPGGHLGARFLAAVEAAWAYNYPDWTLNVETLARADAWLKAAELSEVEATVPQHSADIADSDGHHVVGRLRVQLLPPEGSRYFPKFVHTAIANKELSRARLLGTTEEPEEIRITLNDGEQSKKFILGRDRTPPVRLLVSDYWEKMLTDASFRSWCAVEAASYFREIGIAWDSKWDRGQWKTAQLATKVDMPDEQQGGGTAAGH